MVNESAILRMEGITKTFPGVKALDDVRFDVCAGEIHALAGENGAGENTITYFPDYSDRKSVALSRTINL